MRLLLAITAIVGLMSGCAWSSSSETTQTTPASAPAETVEETVPEPEPVKATSAKTTKTSSKTATSKKAAKGARSEAQIKAELDQTAQKLVNQSARTLLPNKANKEVRQAGGQWVATYNEVNTKNYSTEMKPGSTPGMYVGIIQYTENIFECRGATRQAALSAPCEQARSRRMRELISYDGKKWNYLAFVGFAGGCEASACAHDTGTKN